MDFGVFVFFAAMIYFISVIQNNKKRRKRNAERPLPEETEREETRAPETRMPERPRAQAGGYDASEFRKKLRTAWKMPEKKADDATDLPDELEKPVYREPVRSAEEAPVCADERKPAEIRPEKRIVLPERAEISPKKETKPERSMTAAETERQRRFLEYAARARQEEAMEPVRAAAFAETRAGEKETGLTAADARRWVMYDAVFGAPRAKRPFFSCSPLRGGRRPERGA